MISKNYPQKNHELDFITYNDRVVITDKNGCELAELRVETMERDVKVGDRWIEEPTENFFLRFNILDKNTSLDKNIVAHMMEKESVSGFLEKRRPANTLNMLGLGS